MWDEATRLYQAALEAFRDLEDGWGAASSMADLGTVARNRPDFSGATQPALANESLAILSAQTGNHERALTLAGAAAQGTVEAGIPGSVTDQPELSRWIATAHDSIERRAAESAFRKGSLMSLAEAARYADQA